MKFIRFFSLSCILLLAICCAQMEAREDLVTSSVQSARMFKAREMGPDDVKFWHEKLSDEKIKEHYGADAIKQPQAQGIITLQTKGIRPGDRYTLYNVNALLNKAKMAEFVANREGQLHETKKGTPLSGFELFQSDQMNGESTYYALVSADNKKCLVTQVTLDPIEFTWADGAYINGLVLTKDATQFLLAGKGFVPGEELLVTSTSGKEVLSFSAKANSDGTLYFMLLPGVKGVRGGAAALLMKRQPSKEAGTLKYLWGTSAQAKAKQKT